MTPTPAEILYHCSRPST